VAYQKKEPREQDWEFYNLRKDPAETTGLAASNPDKVLELYRRFLAHRARDHKQPNFPDGGE
jgi:hypothetical protein